MKNVLLISILVVFTGCVSVSHIAQTTGVSESQLNTISKNASEIIVEKSISASGLYEEVYSVLISRGHRISKDDKERYYITTEGKDAGESTLQRSTIVISEGDGVSTALIRSEWKPGTEAAMGASIMAGIGISSDWSQAKWETGRPGIAFAEGLAIANSVKNGKITFK